MADTENEAGHEDAQVRYQADIGRSLGVPKASSVLADTYRARIVNGEWAYGESIGSESELVENSGFSRATVRESLRMLEAEGLMSLKRGPKGGISITKPDLTQVTRSLAFVLTLEEIPMSALFEFRKLLEPAAAALGAKHITADQAELLKVLAKADSEVASGYQKEADFHGLIAEITGNQLLRIQLVVPNELLRLHLQANSYEDEYVEGARKAHLSIADAIVSGDSRKAEHLMLAHLEGFEELISRQGRLDEPIVGRRQWEGYLHRGR